jgi:hypothetical protein
LSVELQTLVQNPPTANNIANLTGLDSQQKKEKKEEKNSPDQEMNSQSRGQLNTSV